MTDNQDDLAAYSTTSILEASFVDEDLSRQEKITRLVRFAVVEPRLRLTDLARLSGLSGASVCAYNRGARTPTPKSARKLARALQLHSRRLLALVDALNRAAAD